MPNPWNITGSWVGHYVQRDQPHGLLADLVQSGNTIRGSMRDRDDKVCVLDTKACTQSQQAVSTKETAGRLARRQ